MSEAYVECLVKAKPSILGKFFKYLLIMLTVALALLMFLTMNVILMILAVVTGAGAYFVNLFTDLEYEYLYLDKELVIDKVMAKSRRKRVATYSLDKVEILAPIKSYHLDNYKNRNVKQKDYSIGIEEKPDLRYAMYYEGGEKLLLSPSPEMIKIMKNVAPRKVFSD
jgi:cellulose synthase/poly-beta-1,6-N-acetylglucosamine synthase-like glycosyltransferase